MNKPSNILTTSTRDAEHAICCGFIWAHTPQGHEYWAEVVQNLTELRRANEAQ